MRITYQNEVKNKRDYIVDKNKIYIDKVISRETQKIV